MLVETKEHKEILNEAIELHSENLKANNFRRKLEVLRRVKTKLEKEGETDLTENEKEVLLGAVDHLTSHLNRHEEVPEDERIDKVGKATEVRKRIDNL